MDTSFRRARSADEKEERRAHLLATVRASLADGVDLRALSLNEIARRADMAKANVYRYYESREALLLGVLQEEWRVTDAALRADLAAAAGLDGVGLADVLASRLAASPMLCGLIAALPSVLEQNLAPDTISRFKRETLAGFVSTGSAMHAACPSISAEHQSQLLHDACVVIAGLHPFAHPAPAAASAMRDPALASMQRDFRTDLRRLLSALAARMAHDGSASRDAGAADPAGDEVLVLPWSRRRTQPWKNGGGVTHVLFERDDLRISVAEVAQPGPFSSFPGFDRTIVLLEGRRCLLRRGEWGVELRPRSPFTFHGEDAWACAAVEGPEQGAPALDFNVMRRRDAGRASVWCVGPGRVDALCLLALEPGTVAGVPLERLDLAVVHEPVAVTMPMIAVRLDP
jgi:AcrR family transcriptional regulator